MSECLRQVISKLVCSAARLCVQHTARRYFLQRLRKMHFYDPIRHFIADKSMRMKNVRNSKSPDINTYNEIVFNIIFFLLLRLVLVVADLIVAASCCEIK